MVGSRLFHLLNSLNASQGKTLINICKNSQDKRFAVLKHLVASRPYDNAENFEKTIFSLFKVDKESTPTKLNNEIRRFADFACGEIEDVILRGDLKSDSIARKTLLAKHFLGSNESFLLDHYLNASYDESVRNNDYVDMSICLDYLIVGFAKLQTDKSYKKLKELTSQKFNFIQDIYHRNLSEYYNMVSNLYIDDTDFLTDAVLPDKEQFENLINQSKKSLHSLVYQLALSRLNFTNEAVFKEQIEICKKRISVFKEENEDKNKIYRRILFTEISIGFHFGWANNFLINETEKLLVHNEKHKYYDDGAFFYYLMFLVINNQIAKAKEEFELRRKQYFKTKSSDLLNFIKCIVAFKEGNEKAFKNKLARVTYGESYYMIVWSRLMEIAYWIKNDDLIFAENLAIRFERYLNHHKHKPFTLEDNYKLLRVMKRVISKGKISESALQKDYFACTFHKMIFAYLSEAN